MTINFDCRVGDLVLEHPEAMPYLEAQGLDFCCHGHRTLREACEAAGRPFQQIQAGLAELEPAPIGTPTPAVWLEAPLAELLDHIERTHHAYLRTALPRLEALITKVHGVHGANHPELDEVFDVFQSLAMDLGPHLMKEEQILFPFIRQLASGAAAEACFASVQSPIRVMEAEHVEVGGMLARLRKVTHGYAVPADGCASFQALYGGLKALEADTHLHICLENQILHPRACALEAERQG